jgi:hypothetical protein
LRAAAFRKSRLNKLCGLFTQSSGKPQSSAVYDATAVVICFDVLHVRLARPRGTFFASLPGVSLHKLVSGVPCPSLSSFPRPAAVVRGRRDTSARRHARAATEESAGPFVSSRFNKRRRIAPRQLDRLYTKPRPAQKTRTAAQSLSKGRTRPKRPYRAFRQIEPPWRKRSGHLLALERPQRLFAI